MTPRSQSRAGPEKSGSAPSAPDSCASMSSEEIEPAILHELQHQRNDRLYDFRQYRVPQIWHVEFNKAKSPEKLYTDYDVRRCSGKGLSLMLSLNLASLKFLKNHALPYGMESSAGSLWMTLCSRTERKRKLLLKTVFISSSSNLR